MATSSNENDLNGSSKRRYSFSVNWKGFLYNGFVFGIPFIFKGKFIEDLAFMEPKEERKLLESGKIHRIPQKLIKKLPHLRVKSRSTAGVRVEFATSAEKIRIRAEFPRIWNMDNMAPLAQRSLNILVDGKFLFHVYKNTNTEISLRAPIMSDQISKHLEDKDKSKNAENKNNKNRTIRNIKIIFPTYAPCKLKDIDFINAHEDHILKTNPEYNLGGRPIIYYGSSITQGGCASRSFLNYPQLISDQINMNYINLGFSGAGYGEPEMAEFISSINYASLFVLDWGANLLDPVHKDLLEKRYIPFWEKIHEANPKTPILFVGLQTFVHELMDGAAETYINSKRQFIKRAALKAMKELNSNNEILADYVDGQKIISPLNMEYTVDGTHPNDLGFMSYAQNIRPIISKLLKLSSNES
ncbi:MAG: SGNH/GDSL hydrolase family protein [Promethearchaeota archaeon]